MNKEKGLALRISIDANEDLAPNAANDKSENKNENKSDANENSITSFFISIIRLNLIRRLF